MLVFWDSVCICLQYISSHFKSSLAIQSYRLWRHIGKLCKESSIQCNLGPRRKTSNSCCNIAYIQKAIQQFVQAPEQELTLRWGCSTSNTPAYLLSHSLAATLIKIKGVEQMILYAPLFLWGNRNPEEAICATGSPGCASWPHGETEYFKVLPGKTSHCASKWGAGLVVLDLATFSQSLTAIHENFVSFFKPHFCHGRNNQM